MFWEGGARQMWWFSSDSGAASTAQGTSGAAGDRRGDNATFTFLKPKCG